MERFLLGSFLPKPLKIVGLINPVDIQLVLMYTMKYFVLAEVNSLKKKCIYIYIHWKEL